jgi:hypothetical protein
MANAKTLAIAKLLSVYVYNNIVSLASGRRAESTIPSTYPTICLCSLGPDFAVIALNNLILLKPKLGRVKVAKAHD